MNLNDITVEDILQDVLTATPDETLLLQPVYREDGSLQDLLLMGLNQSAEQVLNQPARSLVRQSVMGLVPQLTGPEVWVRYQTVLQTGKADHFACSIPQADQPIPAWYDVSAKKLGRRLLLTYKEMTKAKLDDRSNRQIMNVYQESFDTCENGITIFEPILDQVGLISDFRFVLINQVGLQLSGYTWPELQNRTLWEIYPSTRINGLFDQFVQVYNTGVPFTGEKYYPEYDLWRAVTITRVSLGIMVAYRDITTQKNLEQTIRQQAQQWETSLAGLPIGVAVLTAVRTRTDTGRQISDFRLLFINDPLSALLRPFVAVRSGQSIGSAISHPLAPELLKRATACLVDRKPQVIDLPVAGQGKRGWYRVSMAPQGDQLTLAVMDITELKQTQAALEQQAELLRSTLDGSQNAVMAINALRDTEGAIIDFQYVLQNEANRRRTGLTDEQFVKQTLLGNLPPEVVTGFFEPFKRVVDSGEPLQQDFPLNSKSAVRFANVTAVRRGDGLVLTIMDKTAEVESRQQLQHQIEILQAISDSVPIGLVLWEAVRDESPGRNLLDFRYRLSNPLNAYLTGYPPEMLIGQDLLALFPRFRGGPLETVLRETLGTGRRQGLIFSDYLENRPGWFEAQFTRVGDAVLMTYVDVTEAHQAQRLQKQQTDLLRTVLNAQPSGIVLFEPLWEEAADGQPGTLLDFTYRMVNTAELKLTGRTAEELIGSRLLLTFPQAMEHELFANLVEVVQTGVPKEWLMHYTGDGINGWFQSSLIRHDAYVLFTFLDVTALQQQKQALETANQNLRRSQENMQKFAFVASHDLQEPLRKIQSFGDILTTHYATVLDAAGLDMVQRMKKGADRMSLLVKELLTYSRLSTQLISFHRLSMTDLVEHVRRHLTPLIEQSGALLELEPLPEVYGDHQQLALLMEHLLSNALKFHQPGRVPFIRISGQLVPASAVPAGIIAPERTPPFYAQIRVADNGIGFDEKYLDRIFQVFQRLHGKERYGGVGIGLAVCLKIVQNHNGSITASSQPGSGATFHVYLPASQINETLETR